MPSTPPPLQEWDQLAEKAAQGIIRNSQRHRSIARKRLRVWWYAGFALLLALTGVAYYFRAPIAAWSQSLYVKLESEIQHHTHQAPGTDRWPVDSDKGAGFQKQ